MAKLRHSAPDWCFLRAGDDPGTYYRALKAIGYSGAEMVDVARIPLARDAGLEVLNMVAPGMQNGLADAAHQDELLGQIRTTIAAAAKHGVPNVVVFSGNREGRNPEQAIGVIAAGLKKLAPYAEQNEVTLLFEALNTFDHPDYLATNTPFVLEVLRQSESPAIKLVFDIYHMHRMGEDTLAMVTKSMPKIGHIHTAAAPHRGLPALGGEIPYDRIVSAARRAGYTGYWGHEFLPSAKPLEDVRACFDLFESWAAFQPGEVFYQEPSKSV